MIDRESHNLGKFLLLIQQGAALARRGSAPALTVRSQATTLSIASFGRLADPPATMTVSNRPLRNRDTESRMPEELAISPPTGPKIVSL
jgi:hypothetical protein